MYKFTSSEILPHLWTVTILSAVAEINPPINFTQYDDDTLISFVPMPLVEELTGRLDSSRLEKLGKVKKGYTRFLEGDVLFAKITPCMENGKVAIASNLKGGIGAGSTEFHVLRPRGEVSNQYILYYLLQNDYRGDAQHHMTGMVGQKRVPSKFVEDSEIPLAPLNEQRRIVSKIEELFSRLDDGEAALRRVQQLLASYRQSVLKAAVTGELIGVDDEQWEHCTIGELLTDLRYGTAKKCAFNPSKTPVLRIPNVVTGRIDLTDLKHADFTESEIEKLGLRKDDILLVRSNGSVNLVARSAIVGKEAEGYLYAGYLIRLRLKQYKVLPSYLHLFLHSPKIRSQIERQARSTSGVHNINSDEIKSLALRLPSLAEQSEIVDRIDDIFSRIDALEAWCNTELTRSITLRQSILKAAFSGQLVEQDPSDEPASALLQRIHAARQIPVAKPTARPSSKEKVKRMPKQQPTLWEPT